MTRRRAASAPAMGVSGSLDRVAVLLRTSQRAWLTGIATLLGLGPEDVEAALHGIGPASAPSLEPLLLRAAHIPPAAVAPLLTEGVPCARLMQHRGTSQETRGAIVGFAHDAVSRRTWPAHPGDLAPWLARAAQAGALRADSALLPRLRRALTYRPSPRTARLRTAAALILASHPLSDEHTLAQCLDIVRIPGTPSSSEHAAAVGTAVATHPRSTPALRRRPFEHWMRDHQVRSLAHGEFLLRYAGSAAALWDGADSAMERLLWPVVWWHFERVGLTGDVQRLLALRPDAPGLGDALRPMLAGAGLGARGAMVVAARYAEAAETQLTATDLAPALTDPNPNTRLAALRLLGRVRATG